MRTDGSARPATQGLQPTQPGALPSGKAGSTGSARVLPQPRDLMLRKSWMEGTPRPRTQVALPAIATAGLDLAEQRRRADVARLAGEVARLAGRKQDLQQQVDEQARLLRDAQERLSQAERDAVEPEVPRRGTLAEHLAAALRTETVAAAVPELRRQVSRIDGQHRALEQELQAATTGLQEVQQRLAEARPEQRPRAAASPAMTPATPATPVTPATPPGSATPGISPDDLRKALQTALEAGTARAAQALPPREPMPEAEATQTGSTPAALSALELDQLHRALPHGGAAVARLARRARLQEPRSRFDRLRAPLQRAPRPLEGQLLERFNGRVRDDIAAIARKSGQPPLQAAELMQRAVHTGVLGASLPAQAREQLSQALADARAHLAATLPATAEGPAAPAGPQPRPAAINKLGSGATLDLMLDPQASIATLTHDQVAGLLAALGLGMPDADELEFSKQKDAAVDLLRRPLNPMHHDPEMRKESLEHDLPKEVLDRLEKEAATANVDIGVSRKRNPDPDAPPTYELEFRFGGSQKFKDTRQNAQTALGGVGPVYKATDRIAAIMADLFKRHGPRYEISLVSGASLGGGTAQAFLAGVESRTPLPVSPPLVLLDPQLLNDAQARAATRNGSHGYDFQKQRGVALSLDYADKPHKGLMDVMKGPGGYRHPGLLHIRLGLDKSDGPGMGTPKTTALPLGLNLGYHGEEAQFRHAIRRFTRDVGALSEAGRQALIAKFEQRWPARQPPVPEITPASPREDGPSESPRMGTGGSHESIRPLPASAAAGSGVTAALPQGPSLQVDPAGTAVGELPSQDPSAPAKAKPKGVAINRLNSGVKVDLSRQPEATLVNLQPQELDALFRALKLGHPRSDARELHHQKRQAQALLDDFCDKLPTLMKRTYRAFHGSDAAVTHLMHLFPERTRMRLKEAAEIAHCKVLASEIAAPGGTAAPPKLRLHIYFGAVENGRDINQLFKTAVGGRGSVYKAADEVAALLADGIRAVDSPVEIGFVSGASLGGGTAQVFLAGLESRVRLPESPPLILLDPPLLNNTQSRHATRHGEIDYDFEKPRGIAISLDYDKDPRRGLMGVMKGPGGYKYPGLLHLRLGLTDTDGPNGGRPVPSRLGLGYHHYGEEFIAAIHRFTSDSQQGLPPAASLRSDRPGPSGT